MTSASHPLSIPFIRPAIPHELIDSITNNISPSSQNFFLASPVLVSYKLPCFVRPDRPLTSYTTYLTLSKLWLVPTDTRLDLAISFMKDRYVGIAYIISCIEDSWIGEVGWRLYQRTGTLMNISRNREQPVQAVPDEAQSSLASLTYENEW